MNAILGYARVSTGEQDLEGQRRRLQDAGTLRIFEDVSSGRKFERPGLAALLEYARQGDVLCVVRLDRLGRFFQGRAVAYCFRLTLRMAQGLFPGIKKTSQD